jgi:prolyl 4-hydroxylase
MTWARTLQTPADAEPTAERLARRAGVQKVPSSKLDLYIAKAFLDENSCAQVIALIDARRRPSTIADDTGIADFRTSETCDLDPADPIVAAVNMKICELLGLDPALGEPLQGQRYAKGQEFRAHTDTFNPGGYDFYLHTAERGQRTWTAMVYLNVPEEGGATRFKSIGKTVQPELGKLIAWNNLAADGSPNPATLHQGMKVRTGVKYVITKWFRQRPAG